MKSKTLRLMLVAMLIAVMSFTLVGCGGGSDTAAPSNGSSSNGQAAREPEFEWTVASAWVAGFRFNEYVEKHMELIEKYSDGRIKINLYTGNELVPSMETWDAIESGMVEAGHL